MSKKEKTGRSKNKGGRPPKAIDWSKVDVLCKTHCPANEIVEYLNQLDEQTISYDTYDRRAKDELGISFAEYIRKRHMALAKPRLRQLQWDAAERGNITMLIFLGKQYLEQKDVSRKEMTGADGQSVQINSTSELTDAQLEAIIKGSGK